MTVRAGEEEKTWFRSERIFRCGEGWYFMTRESTQEGPYGSRQEAERELIYYIRHENEWGELSRSSG